MKKLISILLSALICMSLFTVALADTEVPIKLISDAKIVKADTMIVNNRTLIPLRALMESTGAEVVWNGEMRSVAITRGGKTITIAIDSTTMVTPEGNKTMDTAPIIINNSTYAPIRAIAEEFGLKVDWDGGTRTILVTTPDGCPYVDFYNGATVGDLVSQGTFSENDFTSVTSLNYAEYKDKLFTLAYNNIPIKVFAANEGLSLSEFRLLLSLPEDYPETATWGEALGDTSFGAFLYNVQGLGMNGLSVEECVTFAKQAYGLGDEYTSTTPYKFIRPIMETIDLEAAKREEEAAEQLKKDKKRLPELTKNKTKFTITLNDGSVMRGELYPDLAPETVKNFVELANSKFYDGLIFHRVIDGFMIQGGGYDRSLELKESQKTIKGEFYGNGFSNPLSHEKGVISMARTNDPNSASSQFFIMDETNTSLDGNYAAFGKITSGLNVLEKISKTKTETKNNGMEDVPVSPVVIKSIRIN